MVAAFSGCLSVGIRLWYFALFSVIMVSLINPL